MLRALAIAPIILAVACAPSPPAYPASSEPDPTDAPDPPSEAGQTIDVQALARDVARLRHVPLRAPIVVHALSSADFVQRLGTTSVSAQTARDERADAFWHGFGFVAEGASARGATRRVLAENVSGFYDPVAKQLFLRDVGGDGDHVTLRAANDRRTLVHEIEHALQDSTFGMPSPDAKMDDDTALALRAMYEGDAMLTEIADEAHRQGTAEHWVSRVSRFIRARSPQQLVRLGTYSPELLAAPLLVQRRVIFPYFDGLTLMADVYRAGGLPLVDRVFTHPPISTEQVLHPERYVEGDMPVPVATPQIPPGMRGIVHGTMGELQTAVLLGQCMAPERGDETARGWGGDAYAVVEGGGVVSLLWSTVWDDEDSADRFERAARARQACMAGWDPDPHVARDVFVLRDGKKVAYVQGLTPDAREPAARALLALVGDVPAKSRPLGDVSIPPLIVPEDVFAHRGTVDANGAFDSHLLGMRAQVPRGFRAAAEGERGQFELLVSRKVGSFALTGFQFKMSSESPDLELAYVRSFMKELKRDPAFHSLWRRYLGKRTTNVGGQGAATYEWQFPRGGLRIAFTPACGGKATVAVVSVWIDASGQAAADTFARTLVMPARDAQVCAYLAQVVD